MNVNNNCYFDIVSDLKDGYLSIVPEGYEELADMSAISSLGPDALIGEIVSILSGRGGEVFSFFIALVGISVLLVIAGLLPGGQSAFSARCASLVLSASILSLLYPLISTVAGTLSDLNSFFSALVPLLLGFISAGGGAVTSGGLSYTMGVTVWITGALGGAMLLPLMGGVLATSALSSFGGTSERIAVGVKSIFGRVIGIFGVALGAIFALQTFISVSADSVSLRAAKYAAGGLIPIVGSSVSGALSTLSSGLSMVGGIIGGSSVAVIVAMSLSPLLILLMYKLAFFLSSLLLDFISVGASAINALSGALDTLISVYIMTIIIYIFEIILIIWGGNSIVGVAW